MTKPKLAVIGASQFQLPLIQRAQQKGCEVHAFAWECGDVGETAADVFHPVSIVDADEILRVCQREGVDGICSIASDLATVAVSRVADAMGLVANPVACMRVSTDKGAMRQAFLAGGDPSPRNVTLDAAQAADFHLVAHGLRYPLIVKPTDRSGSRGVTKLTDPHDTAALQQAIDQALGHSFAKRVIVEEFAEGDEFSIEGMSWEGEHRILTITRKGTTGAPHFIETAHLQPAGLSPQVAEQVEAVVMHALDTLGVRFGASHSELKIAADGSMRLIEIGARMGGDCIGSHLVPLSTGIDFVGAVVDVALGHAPDLTAHHEPAAAASVFLFGEGDRQLLQRIMREHPEFVRETYFDPTADAARQVTDSSTRLGHFILSAPHASDLAPYLPPQLARHARADQPEGPAR